MMWPGIEPMSPGPLANANQPNLKIFCQPYLQNRLLPTIIRDIYEFQWDDKLENVKSIFLVFQWV